MKTKTILLTVIVAITAIGLAGTASATGVLIPKDESIPPLAIKYQRVSAEIKDSVAHTHIEQAFTNSTNRQLEATYIFPLPKDAAIKEFALYINGKRTKAELVEAGKAKKVYEDIVRRMKDPALLEYMDGKLFKMRVFPIPPNGDQKIELDYSQVVDYDNGMMRYVYPLKVGEKYSRTLEDFSMNVNLSSNIPIKTVYSPTHKVSTDFKGEKQAVVGFEEEQSPLDRDFVLYWSFSEEDFGVNVLTQKMTAEDGYFMLMLAPKRDFDEKMIVKKDIVFVLDTSGSMQDEKIEQARKALAFCINSLNKQDRFNIIEFSTEVKPYENKLVEASPENIGKAKEYVDKIEALGATDINGALKKALDMRTDDKRPFMVIFITDGKPTIGVKDTKSIIANIQKADTANTRIFVFGVGYRVNTDLLDAIARETRGVVEYVEPEEDIDHKVTSFYGKASHPVLSNVKLSFGDKLRVYDMYPREMPDLFKGTQLLVFGRYNGSGDYSVTLTGEVNGEPKEYVYEATFPDEAKDNEFIERLWAVRRVGYLIEEIRLNGEEKELVDEILHLSRRYGIITPYTSFLIVEDERTDLAVTRGAAGEPAMRRSVVREEIHEKAASEVLSIGKAGRSHATRPSRSKSGPMDAAGNSEAEHDDTVIMPVFDNIARGDRNGNIGLDRESYEAEEISEMAQREAGEKKQITFGYAGQLINTADGWEGVKMSKKASYMKDSSSEYQIARNAATRNINRRNFYKIGETWVDSEYKEEMTKIRVRYGSEAYFKLLELKPELKDYLALGTNLILTVNGNAIFIEDVEKMEDEVKISELEKLLEE